MSERLILLTVPPPATLRDQDGLLRVLLTPGLER